MSTRIDTSGVAGMVGSLMSNQDEINGAHGVLAIVLPLIGGDEFSGGVVVTARLPNIKNKVCAPKEDRDMTTGGC
jgi:hypothetical protein